jgi:hypothetical protein
MKTTTNVNGVGSGSSGSAKGFWRSLTGENHGRDSRPGDVWIEPGDITDTDRINFCEQGGWALLIQGPDETFREAIDAAILQQNIRSQPHAEDNT